ncbi:hypothetical protein M0R45_029297 [Rubus argutus]|uniref:Uncharacterized protein n=1 Tax=Rubus argutus TaxID=59490 RepID=A0AAW1WA53_RUBAR
MSNSHCHRKHGNGANSPVTANSPFKYGPSDQQAQTPSSAKPSMVTLPYSHVDSSLRALAAQAEGFGRLAIGGLHGPLYHVTTLADDGPGSLRDGCRRKDPLWIVFEIRALSISHSTLNVSSHKTIDGRGSEDLKLTGKGLRLAGM